MRGKQSLVLTHFGRIQRIVVSKHTKILYNLALHLLRSLELQEVRLNHLNVLYIKGNSAKSSKTLEIAFLGGSNMTPHFNLQIE